MKSLIPFKGKYNLINKAKELFPKTSIISSNRVKYVAILLILLLATADFFAMKELFTKLNTNVFEQYIYSITCSLCLEGLPTFIGICLSKLKDYTNYKKNDYNNAKIGLGIALIGMAIAFAIVVTLRILIICNNGGLSAFIAKEYAVGSTQKFNADLNSGFIKDIFLLFSPLMTSLFAFVISWVAFPSDNHAQLEKELDILYLDLVNKQTDYVVSRNKLEVERMNIWKDIAGNDTSMPKSTNVFRKESYNRIRNLLIRDCIEKFPIYIERYNNDLKNQLSSILKKMSELTSIEDIFENIKIDDIINQYDSGILKEIEAGKNISKADCWDYSIAKDSLIDDLKRLVNNAVAIAQYKSSSEQHYKERRDG